MMSRPLAVRRHDEILRRVHSFGSVGVAELAESFGVSHETIRRDLKLLASQGHLDVVHGGASRRSAGDTPLMPPAADGGDGGAAAIARSAARLVPDSATVLIDAGTVSLAIARALVGRRGLTICTNSLVAASVLAHVPGNRVHLLGGEIDPGMEATVGVDVARAVDKLRCDVAFVGIAGFSDEGEPTDLTRSAAEIHGKMITSGPAYLVAEHARFCLRTPFRVPHFERAAGLLVDREPPAALRDAWQARDLAVVVAA